MATGDAYALFAVKLGTTVIPQIIDQEIDPGIQEIVAAGDGGVDASFAAVAEQSPRIKFTTTAIVTALTACGANGAVIDQASSSNALEMYFRKRAQGGTFVTGIGNVVHKKATVNLGLLLPRTMQGAQGTTPASIQFEAIPLWDGTNYPIIVTELADPSATGAELVDELFTLGPWYIEGTILEGLQSCTLDFGLQEKVVMSDGSIWGSQAHIASRRPTATCETLDVTPLLESGNLGMGPFGKAISADVRAHWRKKAEGAANVADATAQHVRATFGDGRVMYRTARSSNQDNATTTVVVTPTTADAGTNPLALNLAAAVSGA